MLIFSTRTAGKNGSETVYDLLRSMYIGYYDENFPEIKKTPNGKPYFPERPDVHFSLSHGRTHVLCVISDNPVGCDIEATERKISLRASKYFCTQDEMDMFDPLDLWLLKESYVKLFGLTFASIRNLQFRRDETQIILPDPAAKAKLYAISSCRAAVCSLHSNPSDSIELI